MPTNTTKRAVAPWHFHCPDCGFGDRELGGDAPADAIWCEVCLEEGRYVRLRRWPVEESRLAAGGTLRRRP